MAFDRDEKGHRSDRYSRRGGPEERDRRDRNSEDDREYIRGGYADEDPVYGRPEEQRRWRGGEREEAWGRRVEDGDYDDSYPSRGPSIGTEHRDRFLPRERRADDYGRRRSAWPRGWHGPEDLREDDRWSGPYAGRGPKGYRRSDEKIMEDVCERLTEHPAIDATDIEVTVDNGDVTLAGRVESRAVKHLVEAMVESVSGVKEIQNRLRVAPGDLPPESTRSDKQ